MLKSKIKLSREANRAARAIVKLVEAKTGCELEMEDCAQIYTEVQKAINEALAKAR